MKRMVSSLRPLGALSLSRSVSNPYLYLSTSSARTFSTVACSMFSLSVGISKAAIFLFLCCDAVTGGVTPEDFAKTLQKRLDIVEGRIPPKTHAHRALGQFRR